APRSPASPPRASPSAAGERARDAKAEAFVLTRRPDAEEDAALVGGALDVGGVAEGAQARLHGGEVVLLGDPERVDGVAAPQRGRDVGVVVGAEASLVARLQRQLLDVGADLEVEAVARHVLDEVYPRH